MKKTKTAKHRAMENDRLSVQQLATFTLEMSIERNTPVSNGAGGQADHWAIPYDLRCIKCSLNSHRPTDEAMAFGRPVSAGQYTLGCPPGTDIRDTDRVLIGDKRYEINDILPPVEMEVVRTVFISLIE